MGHIIVGKQCALMLNPFCNGSEQTMSFVTEKQTQTSRKSRLLYFLLGWNLRGSWTCWQHHHGWLLCPWRIFRNPVSLSSFADTLDAPKCFIIKYNILTLLNALNFSLNFINFGTDFSVEWFTPGSSPSALTFVYDACTSPTKNLEIKESRIQEIVGRARQLVTWINRSGGIYVGTKPRCPNVSIRRM